jgi:hypothetical protein
MTRTCRACDDRMRHNGAGSEAAGTNDLSEWANTARPCTAKSCAASTTTSGSGKAHVAPRFSHAGRGAHAGARGRGRAAAKGQGLKRQRSARGGLSLDTPPVDDSPFKVSSARPRAKDMCKDRSCRPERHRASGRMDTAQPEPGPPPGPPTRPRSPRGRAAGRSSECRKRGIERRRQDLN